MADNKENFKLDVTVEKRVIEIPKYQDGVFASLLKNIKRYCKYLKLPAPIVTDLPDKTYFCVQSSAAGKTFFLNGTTTDNYDEAKSYIDNSSKKKNLKIVSQDVSVKEIEIVSEVKPENDWEILGVVDHEEGLIISAPNQQVPYNLVPKNLHDSSNCDHCHTKRYRTKTIFVKNKDTDEIKRVGGSCIRYYLGYDYEKILKIITELNIFRNFFGDAGGGWGDDEWFDGYGGRRYDPEDEIIDVKEIVKYFFWFVINKGYTSKSAADRWNEKVGYEGKQKESTSHMVADYIRYISVPPLGGFGKDAKEAMERWEKERKQYEKILENAPTEYFDIMKDFVEENYKENNFLLNSRNFFNAGGIKIKHVRYIVSACSMYWGKKLSEDRRNEKTKEFKKSTFVGDVGEKEKLENLTIQNISGFEGSFGWTNIYRLTDEKGNIYTKFGTINPRFINDDSPVTDISKGAVVSFTAEIKKHDTYKDIKQTVLGRLSKI